VEQTPSWKRQLRRYPTTQNLLREVIPYVAKKEKPSGDTNGSEVSLFDEVVVVKEDKGSKGKAHAIISR